MKNGSIKLYLRSPSTRFGYTIGALLYFCYAGAYQAWANPALGALALSVGGFIPFYSRLSNRIEEAIQLKLAQVTPGRLGRFGLQLTLNLMIFGFLVKSGIIPASRLSGLGGILGTSALTTAASQGIQYTALALASRDVGEKNRNVLFGLSANVIVTAFATLGISAVRTAFLVVGLCIGGLFLGMGMFSDLRARFAPAGGIGIFFGTFNPFHKTHLAIIRRALEERGLERIYLHSTVVPKLHIDALKKGEIQVATREGGMRIYERTAKADLHVNYFPTGNRFYEYQTRRRLMELAIEDAGLADKVIVLSEPTFYEREGFYYATPSYSHA
jgi:hypothetical protein